jgi:hypothetical protein
VRAGQRELEHRGRLGRQRLVDRVHPGAHHWIRWERRERQRKERIRWERSGSGLDERDRERRGVVRAWMQF